MPRSRIESARTHIGVDALARLAPLLDRAGQLEHFRASDGAIEGEPGHDLRMGEMLAAAAHLPQAFVGLVPDLRKMHQEFALHRPAGFVCAEAASPRLVQRVHDLAENIELELGVRRVADAHRLRILVSRQPGTSHSVSRRSPRRPYMI